MSDPALLDLARELGAHESGLSVVVTSRAGGAAQTSVVNAGVLAHPMTGKRVVGFVARGGANKLNNLRARPRVTVVFRSGWEWVAVEGDAELVGPHDHMEGLERNGMPRVRRDGRGHGRRRPHGRTDLPCARVLEPTEVVSVMRSGDEAPARWNPLGPGFVSPVVPRLHKVLVVGLLLPVLVVGSASVAAASCAPPLSLADAVATSDLVVVGTVNAARSNHRIVTVAVEDIWRGDADAQIEVAGGPDSLSRATSVDRTFVVGQRYLFFIFEPGLHGGSGTFGARYEDNGCTDTRPYTSGLDQLRPASARRTAAPSTLLPSSQPSTPAASGSVGESTADIALGVAALSVCGSVAAVVWWVRRRGEVVHR
jgi:hypothetical protein